MAEESPPRSMLFRAQALRPAPEVLTRVALSSALDSQLRPAILPQAGSRILPTGPTPAPAPAPTAPAPVSPPLPLPVVPAAPATNPFHSLPFPAPGDRIKADDFKALSQALSIIADLASMSGSLCGHTFGEAKLALAGQGYQIVRVMSVFGTELTNAGDAALDSRKVIQVLPVMLGERQLVVIVTEVVDTQRVVPDLLRRTYQEAQDRIRVLVGDVALNGTPPTAPDLVGRTLAQIQQALNT